MFGLIWHRAKVMQVIHSEFDYKPAVPGWQGDIFNAVTRQIRKRGGNEFDSACAFMLVQAAAVSGGDKASREFSERIRSKAIALVSRCNLAADILSETVRAA